MDSVRLICNHLTWTSTLKCIFSAEVFTKTLPPPALLSPPFSPASSHTLSVPDVSVNDTVVSLLENQAISQSTQANIQTKLFLEKKSGVWFLSQTLIVVSQNSDNLGNCGLFCLFGLMRWVMPFVLIISGVVDPKHYAVSALGDLGQAALPLGFSIEFSSIIYILYVSKVSSI